MSRERWQEIARARELLKLPEQVSIAEIKEAYRHRCQDLHPDRASEGGMDYAAMGELNRAYRVLVRYAEEYRIRLTPNECGMNDEEWWRHHFGEDTLWPVDKER